MTEYSKEEIKRIEDKWQSYWREKQVFKTENNTSKPKYYVLDMFPYPSGAGLHVGHPLGYIATDIVARFKRVKGFNVLHPMGYDAFGLPAEQYALEHGVHPAISTAKNIDTFRNQLDRIGFSFDWSREVRTCDPSYYKWTQWIFLKLFDSWFNRVTQKAEPISALIANFEKEGNAKYAVPNSKFEIQNFSAAEWKNFDEKKQREILMQYRLAYLAYTDVNWCEALGTVLANDEVINGVSYRGGYPVVKRQMRQWSLRITEYAERLLKGLDEIDFSESMKEIQRNWIGRSEGALIHFSLTPNPSPKERGASETIQDHVFTADKRSWEELKEHARENRKAPTEAEDTLWQEIRNGKLGHKFRRQHAIAQFIVDFVCIEKKLVVEVDGPIHEFQKREDAEREQIIAHEGFRTIRFSNNEVLNNTKGVLNKIKIELSSPSPMERGPGGEVITVFTTRPDTIFGVDFMVLAPEHPLVKKITSPTQQADIDKYLAYVESRSEVDRMSEVKKVTGCFTGAYAINPFNNREVPIWISEYVLAGYGTGAIMGVPCGDERDHRFAKHFDINITNIIGEHYNGEEANPTYEATLTNSDFLNGTKMKDAIGKVIAKLEEMGIGERQVNYKMRDAGWSRQRYWGEPFPVVFRDDVPYAMAESDLPLELPDTNEFKPSGNGEGPLANLTDWINIGPGEKRDSNTMPTHAGAAWYFLRYMDPHNDSEFASRKALDYWNQVDVYVGGSEHAVAHLLYARLWIKVLHDLGYLNFDEPFKKLINQGKITGDSRFVYRVRGTNKFVSAGLKDKYDTDPLHVDVNIVNGFELDIDAFKTWKPDFANAEFILEDGKYLCGSAIEKMSKSYFNVINPDKIIESYGADTLRMYEMFLGPLEQSKPWNTSGIDGVYKFLRRFWNLFHDQQGKLDLSDDQPSDQELKVLHKTLKKIEQDIDNFSFNTSVSEFMICANELTSLKCKKRSVLEPLVIALSPFAPHLCEEIWEELGHKESVSFASYPKVEEKYLVESSFEYPISINGKVRAKMNFALDMPREDVQKLVLASEVVQKWTEGKAPKKVIIVPGKIVNVVL
ncbi:MAG: leucine--tRNA ligase [Cyclobacteriaceae bacterium]|nr:leucine--tRNA ligase [Cyclobacteriaceae bacterium]